MNALNRKHDLWFDAWDAGRDGGIARPDPRAPGRQAFEQPECASESTAIRHLVDVYNTLWESLIRQADTGRDGIVSRAGFWAAMERQSADRDRFEQALRPAAEADEVTRSTGTADARKRSGGVGVSS